MALAVDGDGAPAAAVDAGAVHALAVEWHGDIAAAVDRHQAAVAAQPRHAGERGARCTRERLAAIAHARSDVVGDERADEELAHARPRDRAGAVVGVGAGAPTRGESLTRPASLP